MSRRKNIGWLPGLIMLLGAIAMLLGARQIYLAVRSNDWPHTTGVVTRAYVSPYAGNPRGYYQAIVLYRYEVNGNTYTSRRIRAVELFSNKPTELEDFVSAYRPGSDVVVYYDPGSPEYALLLPGLQGTLREFAAIIAGAFMLAAALLAKLLIKR